MEKQGKRKETAAETQWVLEGNRTVIPKDAEPSTMPIPMAILRTKYKTPDGVPHPDLEDVLEAKAFVDENHKRE